MEQSDRDLESNVLEAGNLNNISALKSEKGPTELQKPVGELVIQTLGQKEKSSQCNEYKQ